MPVNAEPVEIVKNICGKARPASCVVDIIDPQHHRAASLVGKMSGNQRRIYMPQMQGAGWAGGKTCIKGRGHADYPAVGLESDLSL
jgi:hypothetical protein